MPRELRSLVENGIYHVISKSVNETDIFKENEDYSMFYELLRYYMKKFNIKIFSYCLMKNHYHLLLKIQNVNLSNFIHAINFRYAQYFNKKYLRKGHLFQNRFKSYLIDTEGYLANVSRYIHLNPVEAGIVDKPGNYYWSSYKYFINKSYINDFSIDEFLSIISFNKNYYIKFVEEILSLLYKTQKENSDHDSQENLIKIKKIVESIKLYFNIEPDKNRDFRNVLIYFLIESDFSYNDLSNFFNLSYVQISRVLTKMEKNISIDPFYIDIYQKIKRFSMLHEEW